MCSLGNLAIGAAAAAADAVRLASSASDPNALKSGLNPAEGLVVVRLKPDPDPDAAPEEPIDIRPAPVAACPPAAPLPTLDWCRNDTLDPVRPLGEPIGWLPEVVVVPPPPAPAPAPEVRRSAMAIWGSPDHRPAALAGRIAEPFCWTKA